MNILITGGVGYVGGRVANYLKTREPNTNIFLTARNEKRRFPRWTREFIVLQMNLLDEDSIANSLKNKGIDVIVHLAALNEIDSMKDPESALEVNTKGTYRLLKLANINKINKFIYFSTFHVYGDNSVSIITEQTITKPFHPYAITHRAAEDFVNYSRRYYNMETLVFRLSNGYGYPMHKEVDRWTLVFNDLCKQAVTTGRIVLESSGKQYRDFISLYDVARAVHYFLFVIPDKWGDGLYNLGGDCTMSILEVADKVSKIYCEKYNRDKIRIESKSESNDMKDTQSFVYSIDKLMKTGFHLEGDMEAEIFKTIEVCEQFFNERSCEM